VGALLRKTHLDELPQFINILRGDISLIGPRPEMLEVAMRFDKIVPHYRKRLYVKPGLTGWAQVMHHYVDTDEDEKIKVDYDLYYVQKRSIRLDCEIIVRTVKEMVLGYGR
jgi:lipopolysaccharide/colanic/teichoic acid biosynthesis glycosyltransferase